MVMVRFKRFWQVLNSFGCYRIVVAGFTWLLMVLFIGGWFWIFPDDSCSSWPDQWTLFLSSCLV